MSQLRVVSLLPSASEIVCRIGMEASLVGVSHECDFPASLRGLPALTSSRLGPPGRGSEAIDADVRAALLDALALYTVDAEALASLRPDVIITQDLCEVCAVSIDDVRSAVARLAATESIEIVSLRPVEFSDMLDDVERVAAALGVPEKGLQARRELAVRMQALALRSSIAADRPRVASVEWLSPIMLGGTWMPELIEAAGGVAVGVERGKAAPTVSMDELVALAPDVVLIKPCGFDLAQSYEEPELLEAFGEALPNARIFLADGNAYFNRSGPRLVDSAEILAACLHPTLFPDFANTHNEAFVRLQ